MANCTENVMKSSIERIPHLLFRCDGMEKNINVPKKICNVLKEKYDKKVQCIESYNLDLDIN